MGMVQISEVERVGQMISFVVPKKDQAILSKRRIGLNKA